MNLSLDDLSVGVAYQIETINSRIYFDVIDTITKKMIRFRSGEWIAQDSISKIQKLNLVAL